MIKLSNQLKKKVSIVGINGIPSRYGGFETLAEFLVENLNKKFDFTVYCSSIYKENERLPTYKGASLIHLPIRANGYQSFFYDFLSTIHSLFKYDIILILGPAAGIILPLNVFFKKKIIVNHGGLDEWKRGKYTKVQKLIIYMNHYVASKFSDFNIADNYILKKSLAKAFNVDSKVIKYGGDHVKKKSLCKPFLEKYPFLKNEYDLSISRAQIDNNLHLLLQAYEIINGRNLVIISNWEVSNYGRSLKQKYKNKFENIFVLDAIYDGEILNVLRTNTSLYVHSHSFCGTSPSLVEAMNYNIPIICYDVETNREVTNEKTLYFSNIESLVSLLNNLDIQKTKIIKKELYKLARNNFKWNTISNQYSELFLK